MSTLSAGVHYDSCETLDFGSLPRTYASALYLLSLLPTNRDVTALFEMPKPKDGEGAPVDFNALAIPEVVAWMARAGYKDLPKDLAPLKCIHIAGTKGKGSVSAFATAILVEEAASGNTAVGRVGTYLSPHVISVRERIWLDGQPISRELFTKYVFELWVRLSEAAAIADPADKDPFGAHTKPFYFRFLTLLAFHVFLREGVRSAVVECGIGGEYDATNILPKSSVTAAVVTRLGIDHVAMLGRTLEEIAWHKAGVFKKGVAAITLQQDAPEAELDGKEAPPGESKKDREAALHVLRIRAAKKKALALYAISPDAVALWGGVPGAALPGAFQKYNMALAVVATEHHIRTVSTRDGKSSDAAVIPFNPANIPATSIVALSKATLRGRCETIVDTSATTSVPIEYLVDGAHTADSLREVARYFLARSDANEASARRFLLFSVRDRNPGDLLRALMAGTGPGTDQVPKKHDDYFEHAIFVFPPEAVAAREDALRTMREVCPTTKSYICDSVPVAIGQIRALFAPPQEDPMGYLSGAPTGTPVQPRQVLATGSFVLVREVLQELDADFED
ncbi:hypothetical protein SBRCBS47491_002478 [Sporothrix bragantina]|uniref:tetrahydrofolate synthase n=1 Tax=Sporothrix bragantina TaxID=671064 RepID=A0ABP0B872_9PEZI